MGGDHGKKSRGVEMVVFVALASALLVRKDGSTTKGGRGGRVGKDDVGPRPPRTPVLGGRGVVNLNEAEPESESDPPSTGIIRPLHFIDLGSANPSDSGE